MCVHVGGCSAGTFAALIAIAASLAQFHLCKLKKSVKGKAGGNLLRAGDKVSSVEGGSGDSLGGSACHQSGKDGSISRSDGSCPGKDGPPSRKGGSPSRKNGSPKIHTHDNSSQVGQQGSATREVVPPLALPKRGDAFEGAVTRLAGAAELGTESLIYVRRGDVAEIIDTLVELAKASGRSDVASPALARLSIMRRSGRREGGGRRRDGRGSNRLACSPETRMIEVARTPSPSIDNTPFSHAPVRSSVVTATRAVLEERSVPTASAAEAAVSAAVSAAVAMAAAAAAGPASRNRSATLNSLPLPQPSDGKVGDSTSAMPKSRPLPPQTSIAKADDGATVRRVRSGGRGGEQGRWRSRTRSPPPPAPRANTPMIQNAPPPTAASASLTLTPMILNTPRPLATASASASTTGSNSALIVDSIADVPRPEIKRAPSACAGSRKITRVPIRPVVAGKGGDFEDFWGSGWG